MLLLVLQQRFSHGDEDDIQRCMWDAVQLVVEWDCLEEAWLTKLVKGCTEGGVFCGRG